MYEFKDPEQFKGPIVFLKITETLNGHNYNLSIGDITWICELYIKENDNIYHPEDNRYYENFRKECFEITTTPEQYNHLVSKEYKNHVTKLPKKKLIL